tara:strand:+ start:5670 stop:5798 length:129 start_codon:yes stop_codon:yes gene_type:complete
MKYNLILFLIIFSLASCGKKSSLEEYKSNTELKMNVNYENLS